MSSKTSHNNKKVTQKTTEAPHAWALKCTFPPTREERNPGQAPLANHPPFLSSRGTPHLAQPTRPSRTSSLTMHRPRAAPQGPPRRGRRRHIHTTRARLAFAEEASNARRSCSRSRLARVDHALTRPHAGLGLLGGIHWCSCTCVRSVLCFFILKYTSLCCSVYGPNCICCFMALVQFFETRRGISDGRSQRHLLDMCVWGQQKAR